MEPVRWDRWDDRYGLSYELQLVVVVLLSSKITLVNTYQLRLEKKAVLFNLKRVTFGLLISAQA